MEVKRLTEHVRPDSNDYVRFKDMGNVAEIMTACGDSTPPPIRKISADLYEDLRTGEIKEYKHTENRGQNLQGVARSLGMLRDLLNTNVKNVLYCRWVTLTYRQRDNYDVEPVPMRDTVRLYSDFKKYNMRMRRMYGDYEYIACAEPQGSGSWHLHVLMIFPKRAPFIPNSLLADKWGQGYVVVGKLDNVDNVGAYLTAYLGDMELNEALNSGMTLSQLTHYECKEIEFEKDGEKRKKAFVKGARLHMYPNKFNLYRCSRGIKKPDIRYMTAEKAEKKVSSGKLTFEKTLLLADDEQGFARILNYRYYNMVRK